MTTQDHTAALLEAIARHFPDDPANAARAHAALTDALVHPQPSRTLTQAVVSCPHEITAEAVILRYDPDRPGKNAFGQLLTRIAEAQPQQPAGWRPTDDQIWAMYMSMLNSVQYLGKEVAIQRARDVLGAPAHPSQQDAKDVKRFEWWFSFDPPKNPNFVNVYLQGMHERWNLDQWRAAIDAAIAAQQGEGGAA